MRPVGLTTRLATRAAALVLCGIALGGGCVFEDDGFLSSGLQQATADELAQRDALAARIEGRVVFGRGGSIYSVELGQWEPVRLCDGLYARWSPDGSQIVVFDQNNLYVANADGSDRTLLVSGVQVGTGSSIPMEFHSDGQRVIFCRDGDIRTVRVDDPNDQQVLYATSELYLESEFGISADGERMVARYSHRVYAIDLVTAAHHAYNLGVCSAMLSPDGTNLFNNVYSHAEGEVKRWQDLDWSDPSLVPPVHHVLPANCEPDGTWDNHSWSNDNSFFCAEGDGDRREAYVYDVDAQNGCRVTWTGSCAYPDLHLSNWKPVVAIGGPTAGGVGQPLTFTADAQDPDGTVTAYAWQIDGEPAGTGDTLDHTFAAVGTYQLELTVTDDQGGVRTRQHTVSITQ